MNEHETIADIIAEKRRRADEIERDCAEKMKRGEMVSDCYARELVADIRREADRLEAAYKRERVLAVSIMRSKLYGIAGGLRAITARSDARQRGIHYTEVQNIAAQIENIADNGGEA